VRLGLGTLTPSLAGGNDFAFGGAETGPTDINPANPLANDLPEQVAAYAQRHPTPVPGALYTLDIGANNIRAALEDYASGAIPLTEVTAVVAEAAANNSLCAAVFVILDMDRPYEGLFGIPSTSMRNALADMMR
jgi:phospholipase/lecithinase/hemolysin